MNLIKSVSIFALVLQIPGIVSGQHNYVYHQVPFNNVKIDDGFWAQWQQRHRLGTISNGISQIRDSTNRLANFEIAAGIKQGKFKGNVWDDSDVYKVIEGIAYSLQNKPDSQLEKMTDEWIDVIARAQRPDGYLVTFHILEKNDDNLGRNLGPWSDNGRHEMYNGGHLIESAIAYYNATGKRKLLDVATKVAQNWLDTFGPGKRHWVTGHTEPELALVKLFHHTGEKKYLNFAHWLLEERGHGYEQGPMMEKDLTSFRNIQSTIPVKDLRSASGHAVCAMYLYCGMTDIVGNTPDDTYLTALNAIWKDMTAGKMYITGGIGSSHDGERFGEPYDLPNQSAYCETCASVGLVFWSSRMNLLFGDAKYANTIERTLYNALIAGVSITGEQVSYTNTLESNGTSHNRGHVYGTACCPTNIARFIPSVADYMYITKGNEILVNLYAASTANITIGTSPATIIQQTSYPWDGKISISIDPQSTVNGKIKLRIPDWCTDYTVNMNGQKIVDKKLENGYLTITRDWRKGDVIDINFDMPVVLVKSDPQVKQNIGRRAVQRGPLVYSVEQADNPGLDLQKLQLTAKNKFTVVN